MNYKKILPINSCDQCWNRVYNHPDNYCWATKEILPDEIDEDCGIPIPDNCPLPNYIP